MSFQFELNGANCRIWPEGPAWDGVPAAAIGKLDFPDVASGAALLKAACDELGTPVLAPMDGDTWHSYRAVTQSDGSPPYMLEPVSGPHDAAALAAAGFAPVSDYVSSRAPVPEVAIPAPGISGITIRAWDGTDAEPMLDRLFALSGASFADKGFFKPIERDAFLGLYRPLLPLIDPRLVLFAMTDGGDLAGFLFGIPDRLQGAEPDTAILKTYAGGRPGVGHLLAHTFHEKAREYGYAHVVHALMHVDNVSLRRSAQHSGEVFRRYSLFGRR